MRIEPAFRGYLARVREQGLHVRFGMLYYRPDAVYGDASHRHSRETRMLGFVRFFLVRGRGRE